MSESPFKRKNPLHTIDRVGGPDEPWFTRGAIEFLDTVTKGWKVHSGFPRIAEFGAGSSTLWFAERMKHVVTIEHDFKWAAIVNEELKKKNINNVDLMCVNNWNTYINFFKLGNLTNYHMIVVDGRRRVECILKSLDQVMFGGFLILDNSDRERYKTGIEVLKLYGFERLDFPEEDLFTTSIFKRK